MNSLTFNQILDIAIVLVATYSALSTVCSSIHEFIATLLALRGWDLFRGISQLVSSDDVAAKIMNHPLINTTSTKPLREIKVGVAQTDIHRFADLRDSGPPSYIDARNFSVSFWQIIHALPPGYKAGSVGTASLLTAGATASPAANSTAMNAAILARNAASSAPSTSGSVTTVAALPGIPTTPTPATEVERALLLADPTKAIAELTKVVSGLAVSPLRTSLLALLAAAGNDYDKLLRATDGWFNAQMDRVSGWYKRRTTSILCVIALAVTLIASIDSVHIVKVLTATDAATMQRLLAEAKITTSTFDVTQFTNIRWDVWTANYWIDRWPGVLLTWLAVWLGGSFWFDLLSSLVNVRATGRKPERTDQPPR